MPRTIADVPIGTLIKVPEGETHADYFILKRDENGTIILRDLLAGNHRMNATNVTTYDTSEMDSWLRDTESGFASRFSADMLSCLANRSIPIFDYGAAASRSISRSIYLLSYGELFLDATTPTESEPSSMAAFYIRNNKYISANNVRIAKDETSLAAANWWLRSPNSAANYCYVNSIGSSSSNSAGNSYGVRPALNVSNDTIVSDEGANEIYLLPTYRAYNEVEFEVLIGECQQRPKKAVVKYDAVNLENVNVQVCNNFGDDEPVWEDATDQQEVVFTNESKETSNWQIGVRCYGRKNGYGYFMEPQVIIEEE